jgi:hypothetical protein
MPKEKQPDLGDLLKAKDISFEPSDEQIPEGELRLFKAVKMVHGDGEYGVVVDIYFAKSIIDLLTDDEMCFCFPYGADVTEHRIERGHCTSVGYRE